MAKPTLGFVGAGKVGQTLARLWHARGYRVAAVASRSQASASVLAAQVGAQAVAVNAIVAYADLILLTVPDDALEFVAGQLASQNGVGGRGFLHTSGAHDSAVLAALAARGGRVGSLHPAFPFADVELALTTLPGSVFALDVADETLRADCVALVEAADGRVLHIPSGKKALYHAALVLCSNYTVTLYGLAQYLLLALDADRETADAALNALLGGTVDNLRARGIPEALTGPLARGDAGTVAAHVDALGAADRRLQRLYIELARLTLPLVEARGVDTNPLSALLGGSAASQE